MIAEPDKNDVIELTPEEKKELAKKAKKEAAKAKKVEKKLLKALQEKEERLQQKRDEYNREVGFASKTYDDHAKDWEKMLVDVNQDSMRNEVEILTAEVTQLLDRKQNIIERLAAERLLAQKQAERSIAAHIDFFSYSKCKGILYELNSLVTLLFQSHFRRLHNHCETCTILKLKSI